MWFLLLTKSACEQNATRKRKYDTPFKVSTATAKHSHIGISDCCYAKGCLVDGDFELFEQCGQALRHYALVLHDHRHAEGGGDAHAGGFLLWRNAAAQLQCRS